MANVTTTFTLGGIAPPPARPAIEKRPFASLGGADHGWLKANHHFSFAGYHDPRRMGWGDIRVWNDDEIAAGSGFPPHPHDNMEIITYVREGAITHRDSMGNLGRTEAGDVQVMSAGTGVTHAEYNADADTCRLFQIWIMPRTRGIAPRWGNAKFPKESRAGRFTVLASGHADDVAAGALAIEADGRVMGATVAAGTSLHHQLGPATSAYLVLATGSAQIGDETFHARDGAAIRMGTDFVVAAFEDCEIVMVETDRPR